MVEHRTTVPEFRIDRKTYTATCSCGWRSAPHASRRDADNDADGHVIAMTRVEEEEG